MSQRIDDLLEREQALRFRAMRLRRGGLAGQYGDVKRQNLSTYQIVRAATLDKRADRVHRAIRRLNRQVLNQLRAGYGLGRITWES